MERKKREKKYAERKRNERKKRNGIKYEQIIKMILSKGRGEK